MNPPLTPRARALVAAGRSDLEPSEDDLDRVRGRILMAVAGGAAALGTAAPSSAQAAVTASTAGAVGVSGGTVSGGLKLGLVLLLAGAAAGGGAMLALGGSDGDAAVKTAATPPRTPAPAVAPPVEPEVEPEVEFQFEPDRVEPPRRTAPEPRRPPRQAPPPRASSPSLSQELTLVRRARAALRLGMPDRALELLAQHAARFPDARLAQEAAVVRIEAVCATGDSARARSLTADFARAWPHSPLRARVWNMCGAKP